MDSREFSLSPVYIHKGQIFSLLSEAQSRQLGQDLKEQEIHFESNELDAAKRSVFCRWLIRILQGEDVLSLEKALLEKVPLRAGSMVWIENTFYFKGLSSWTKNRAGGYKPLIGQFHSVLKALNAIRVEG